MSNRREAMQFFKNILLSSHHSIAILFNTLLNNEQLEIIIYIYTYRQSSDFGRTTKSGGAEKASSRRSSLSMGGEKNELHVVQQRRIGRGVFELLYWSNRKVNLNIQTYRLIQSFLGYNFIQKLGQPQSRTFKEFISIGIHIQFQLLRGNYLEYGNRLNYDSRVSQLEIV